MREDDYIESLIDPEEGIVPVEIDVPQIEEESKRYVVSMIDNLSKFYYDDEFMKSHPVFSKRVEADVDSLIILIKMRRIDEVTQDSLVKAITNNSNNASLYRALTDVQRTILNVQTKIEDTIKNLQLFMKGYQLELNFDASQGNDDSDDVSTTNKTRGTKEFIQQMQAQM